MKIVCVGVMLLFVMDSCKNINKVSENVDIVEDTINSTVLNDSLAEVLVEEEEHIPMTVDESFTDFIYSFTRDEKMQQSRVSFPLAYNRLGERTRMNENEWQFDPIFRDMDVYTVIHDESTTVFLEQDTTATHACLEWIFLKEQRVKRYFFERRQGFWMLDSIHDVSYPEEKRKEEEEDFYTFYAHFSNDSIFQVARISDPLKFVTFDPDDDFSILETTLDVEQWFAFSPSLPKDTLTNILYGENNFSRTRLKIMELKGNGNGFNNTLYFRKKHGRWKLIEFDDMSD